MQRRLAWLLVPLVWALACGGRYVRTGGDDDDDDDDTSTGQGGSAPSKAGAGSRGGSTGRSGAPTRGGQAAGGSMGTSGSTAAGGGATCNCDPIACGPGYLTVPNVGGCCWHCELDLKLCEVQRQDYVALRKQLVEKYKYGCKTADDCVVYYEKNPCAATTCGIAVTSANYKALVSNLDSYAQMACNPACPPGPVPPCDPIPRQCSEGYCL